MQDKERLLPLITKTVEELCREIEYGTVTIELNDTSENIDIVAQQRYRFYKGKKKAKKGDVSYR